MYAARLRRLDLVPILCSHGADDCASRCLPGRNALADTIRNWQASMCPGVNYIFRTITLEVLGNIEILISEAGSTVTINRLLNQFLQGGKWAIPYWPDHLKQQLMDKYCHCLMLMLLAGSHVSVTDLQLMKTNTLHPVLAPRGILEYATAQCYRPAPATLKVLCKIVIRNLVRKPLPKHLPLIGLPERLQKNLLLTIWD